MEESQRCVTEHHLMFIRRLDALGVHHAAARRSEVRHPALPRPVDIICEREERIARTCHPIQLNRPRLPLLLSQGRRYALELGLPLRLLTTLEDLTTYEQIDRIRLLGTLDTVFEWERKDTRMVAEPPQVGLAARETGAVDTRLLARPETDDGTILGIRDAVGLRVFQRERGDEQICQRVRRKLQRASSWTQ